MLLTPTYSSLGLSGHSFDPGGGVSSTECRLVRLLPCERPACSRGLEASPLMAGSGSRPEQLAT